MSEPFPIDLTDEVAELERELRMRRQAYPRLVEEGKMPQARADRQIAVLASAINRLGGLA